MADDKNGCAAECVGRNRNRLYTFRRKDRGRKRRTAFHRRINFFEAPLPGNAGSTLTVSLYMYAKERGDFDTAFSIALILLVLTFLINTAAKLATRKSEKGGKGR